MKRSLNWLLLALCVSSLLVLPLQAQKSSGTITGIVSDPSGAVVPNAAVTVVNTATGLTRTTSTDSQGIYSVPELEPGIYNVTVKIANFKQAVVNAVELHVASTATANVKLEVGGASERVEVNANVVQVQTDSAALGQVIDSAQVRELPLNGGNFMGLTQLAPGVSFANSFNGKDKGLAGGVDFSVNGNSVTNNLYLVDGANNNDVGSNRTILVYPANESIAEFKMLQNAYGPEYGQASGGVINLVTKGGTNNFHGSIFYRGRNDALNAWEYFNKLNGTNPKLRRNDFGGTFGGPVKKDKLFFFYSEEVNKEIRGVSRSGCVPSAAERSGDFSNPSCGAELPNIPAALQAPGNPFKIANPTQAGLLLIQKYPLPNLSTPNASGDNWVQATPSKLNWRQENARVDYQVTKSHRLMGRFTQDTWDNPAKGTTGWGDDPFPTLNSNWIQPSKMIVGKLSSTIGGSMVNDAEFAYSNNRINVTPNNPQLAAQISAAVPPIFPESLKTHPNELPIIWGGFGAYSGQNYWMQAPWSNTLDIYTFRDDLSKVSGAHTFKVGFFMGRDGKNEDNAQPGDERPQFGNGPIGGQPDTGNALANIMTPGLLFNLGERSTNVRNQLRWHDYEFYAGDTWKARRNLTLEYGIRYSLLYSPFQPNNQMTSWQPFLYDPTKPASDACNGLWIIPGTDPCGAANKQFGTHYSSGVPAPDGKYLQPQNHHLFAPRLGVSYDPTGTGNWAIRGGVGQFFQRDRVSPFFVYAANAPFAVFASMDRTIGGATPASLSGGSTSPNGGRMPTANTPNSWQWNIAIEHQFAKETALQIGYVGNSAIHQTASYDINIPDPSTWVLGAFRSGDAFNALRPYSNFGQLAYWDYNGHATYHSLQTVLKTRYKRSQLTAAYTYSHSISNVQLDDSSGGPGAQSYTYFKDPGLERGNSPINRPHIFTANFTYYLPELKGSNGLVKNILGDWSISGLTTAQSGHSMTMQQGGIGENATLRDGTGQGLNNLIGASLNGMMVPLTTSVACTSGREGSQLFNPQAFTLIGYTIGTLPGNREGRGYCEGPRYVNTDFSLTKTWKLREKTDLQFRMDFFDLFNHANFRADQLKQGTPFLNVNCGPANSAGLYAPCSPTNNIISHQTYQSNFGQAGATIGNAGRELQYNLKITF